MYTESKEKIICPICNSIANKSLYYEAYTCTNCNWISDESTIDIAYKDSLSSPLSNLFPHKFDFFTNTCQEARGDLTPCLSMESFLQSLKIPSPTLQKEFCRSYSGYIAYKMRLTLPDWRKRQILYWNGVEYERHSKEYTDLITQAYDRLFYGNAIFRNIVLPKFKDYYLIHSIGNSNPSETVLTETEYRFQLNRLTGLLDTL